MLPCGHPSCGTKYDTLSPFPCLFEECKDNEILKGRLKYQTGNDYCNICFTEGLIQAPCVELACGHIFHYACIEKRIKTRWFTPRIFFNFCYCQLCKAWMIFKPEIPLYKEMAYMKQLVDKMRKMSLQRLKHEDRDKDKRLANPQDPYY